MKLLNFLLILIITLVGCAQSSNNEMYDILANTEVLQNPVVVDQSKDAFRISYSTWKNKSRLNYFIYYPPIIKDGKTVTDYFNDLDKQYISGLTAQAADEWEPHVNMQVKETSNITQADFVIIWKFLENDGIGGDLALADFPPVIGQGYRPRIIMDMADMWKNVKDRSKAKHPYYNVILHELGHLVAGLRHDDSRGIMNTAFNFNHLQIDDVAGARINYKRYERFVFEGQTYIYIDGTSNKNVTKNFTNKELVSHCSGNNGHFLALNAISSVQYIRGYYECPIKILSSYRSLSCNKAAGGATLSQHIFRTAIDWKFVGKNAAKTQNRFESDINNRKLPLYALLMTGARGLGTYPYGYGTNHIDSRNSISWNRYYNGIGYMVWGEFAHKGSWYDPKLEYKLHD